MALISGLIAALMWASSNLCSSRAVRHIPQYSVVAWVSLVGAAVTAPFAVAGGVPPGLDVEAVTGLSVVGVVIVVGLVLLYGAFRIGKVSVVAPIAVTEGAVAATLSALTGESLSAVTIGLLLLVVAGAVMSTLAPDPDPIEHEQPVKAAILAAIAALFFGLGIFLTGRFSSELPLSWVLLLPRIAGSLVLVVPLLVLRRLRLTRSALPLVSVTGVTEILGYLTFALGARTSIAVVAVMGSQAATFTALGGRFLFGERLGRFQFVGIGVVILGVTGLALVGHA